MATQLKKVVAPSGGDYTSLEACMNANEQNLVAADKYFDVEISGSWSSADTMVVAIHNYTTDATRYINIYTTGSARHAGKWNVSSTYYRLVPTTTTQDADVMLSVDFIKIDGIQVNGGQAVGIEGIKVVAANASNSIIIKDTILKCRYGAVYGSTGFYVNDADATMNCINCLAFDLASPDHGGFRAAAGTLIAKNCMATNCTIGYLKGAAGTLTLTNCIAAANIDDISASGTPTITYSAGDDADFSSGTGNMRIIPVSISDSSSNNIDSIGSSGFLSAAVTGQYGTCIDFKNGEIDFGDVTIFDGISKFSFSCWLYIDALPASGTAISILRKDGTLTPLQLDNTSGTQSVRLPMWNSSGSVIVQSITTTLPTGQWICLQGIWDKDVNSGKVQWFLDGTSLGSAGTGCTTTIYASGTNSLHFGRTETSIEVYDGKLDEVIFFNDVLSTAERDAIRTEGIVGTTNFANDANCIGAWLLDENESSSSWGNSFVDYDTGDFHLKSGSALINAGTDLYGSGVTSDIDGDTLTVRNDIGIDEYVATGTNVTVNLSAITVTAAVQAGTVTAVKNVSVSLNAQSATAAAQALTVTAVQNVTVSLSAITATAAAQAATISTAGNATVSLSAQTTLTVSPQALSVTTVKNATVSLSAITVTVAAQESSVITASDASVSLSCIAITVAPQSISVSGAASVSLSVITAAVSVDTSTDITVSLSAQTITITAQGVTVTADRTITISLESIPLSISALEVTLSGVARSWLWQEVTPPDRSWTTVSRTAPSWQEVASRQGAWSE